jgi:integrase
MKLLFTDESFVLRSQPFVGIPFLLDKRMELVEPANSYLMYLALERGKTRSPKTWRNHGEALYDYFSWLEANNLDWSHLLGSGENRAGVSNLAAYRNWSISLVNQVTQLRAIKSSTVNQRLTCLMGFYRWAQKRGYIASVPWDASPKFVTGNSHDFMRHAHAAKTTEGDDLRLKAFREPPKLLSLDQAKLLIQVCPTRTLRLMTVLMLQTGLRNEECRTFPTKYVFDPTGLDIRIRIRIDLNPSDMRLKNSKPRTVFIGWHVMRDLFDHLSFGEGAMRAKLRRHNPHTGAQPVFLNANGGAFSEKGLNNAYRRLWAGNSPCITFKVTPHMLRHTFATLELFHQSQRMAMGQALAWVRDRLGHSSIQTTSIYLHCIDLMEGAELNAYQEELDLLGSTNG